LFKGLATSRLAGRYAANSTLGTLGLISSLGSFAGINGDSGAMMGALAGGVLADLFGYTTALYAVAALTALSGFVALAGMGRGPAGLLPGASHA